MQDEAVATATTEVLAFQLLQRDHSRYMASKCGISFLHRSEMPGHLIHAILKAHQAY